MLILCLITADSRVNIWPVKLILAYNGNGCCHFKGSSSFVVYALLMLLPLFVYLVGYYAHVLFFSTLCPF